MQKLGPLLSHKSVIMGIIVIHLTLPLDDDKKQFTLYI